MTNIERLKARVVVVIPTLGKRPDLLKKTLSSIRNQSVKCDIVLVYPLQDSRTAKIGADYGVIACQDPGTLSGALNSGFKKSKKWHEFHMWLGDDDILTENSMNTSIAALDAFPDAVLAYGKCNYINTDDKVVFTNKPPKAAPWLMKWGPNLIPLPGSMYRSSAAKIAGQYDTSLSYAMDLDMWLRLVRLGRFINTRKTLGAFRWHADSTTVANRKKSLLEARKVKNRYLPGYISAISILWELPVAIATRILVKGIRVDSK